MAPKFLGTTATAQVIAQSWKDRIGGMPGSYSGHWLNIGYGNHSSGGSCEIFVSYALVNSYFMLYLDQFSYLGGNWSNNKVGELVNEVFEIL